MFSFGDASADVSVFISDETFRLGSAHASYAPFCILVRWSIFYEADCELERVIARANEPPHGGGLVEFGRFHFGLRAGGWVVLLLMMNAHWGSLSQLIGLGVATYTQYNSYGPGAAQGDRNPRAKTTVEIEERLAIMRA